MNKDQRLLEEAYQRIYESSSEPTYFGSRDNKKMWLAWLAHKKHEVHADGSITINDNVSLAERWMHVLPFNFRTIHGFFDCGKNQLKTLKGAPEFVEGTFACDYNELESIKEAPKRVKGSFSIKGNRRLESLEGCPEIVEGHFVCYGCRLHSLVGCPDIVKGDFDCRDNHLTSLDGAPEFVGGKFMSYPFADEEYRSFVKKRKYVDDKLDKDFDVDLGDFS